MATKERRKTPPGAPAYHRLTEGKRIIIETLRKEGLSNRHIADRVGCSPATVGRELKRNLGKRGYRHKKAQAKATTAYPGQRDMGLDRNALMPCQVKGMFGFVPRDLATFVELSQSVQAEALKYWIELSRSRKGRTWGLLWWNLRDGWPIVSDGVVDYYFGKKKAYAAIKSVQQPQFVAYVDTPFEGEVARGVTNRLVAVNDRLYAVEGMARAVDIATGRPVWEGRVEIPANGTKILCENLSLEGRGMLRIDYAFEGVARVNRCLYGPPPYDAASYRTWCADRQR